MVRGFDPGSEKANRGFISYELVYKVIISMNSQVVSYAFLDFKNFGKPSNDSIEHGVRCFVVILGVRGTGYARVKKIYRAKQS